MYCTCTLYSVHWLAVNNQKYSLQFSTNEVHFMQEEKNLNTQFLIFILINHRFINVNVFG